MVQLIDTNDRSARRFIHALEDWNDVGEEAFALAAAVDAPYAEAHTRGHPRRVIEMDIDGVLFDDGGAPGLATDAALPLSLLPATIVADLVTMGLMTAGPPRRMKLRGELVVPRDLARRRTKVPVVFIVMGNHPHVDFATGNVIPSFQGYRFMQQKLADLGMASCSVDTNIANSMNLGIRTRAEILLAMLRQFAGLAGASTADKIDFAKTGFVGHSRGGEAVVLAARLLPSSSPFRVKAVFSIAPTDFSAGGSGTVGGVAMPYVLGGDLRYFVLYGSHDGDVRFATNNGFGIYDRATCSKTMIYARGLTHNRFNQVWNECADYGDPAHLFVDRSAGCRTRSGTPFDIRIFAAVVHRRYANFFVEALMKRVLLADARQEAKLRGITIPTGRSLGQPAGQSGPDGSLQWAVTSANVVDEFETGSGHTLTGGVVEAARNGRPRVPHLTQAYVAGAAGHRVRIDIPSGRRNQSGKRELTFRITSAIAVASEAAIRAAPAPDWIVRLVTSAGTAEARPRNLDRRGLRTPDKPFFHETADSGRTNVTKQSFDTVVIPLRAFRGATLSDVRSVEFEARGGSFPIIVDSFMFV